MGLYNKEKFEMYPPAGYDGQFVWEYIVRRLPPPIRPMDIDAYVEIGGLYLFFETKAEGKKVPIGQRLALRRLLNHPSATVLALWGKTAAQVRRLEIYNGLGSPTISIPATAADVETVVDKWVKHAVWLRDKANGRDDALQKVKDWRFTLWE